MTDRGLVEVNDEGRTSIPHIFAIGDIVAGPALAHKAMYEGRVAAEVIAGHAEQSGLQMLCQLCASLIQNAQALATRENEAKEKGHKVKVGKFPFAANGRALSLNAGKASLKSLPIRTQALFLARISPASKLPT